MLIDTKLHIPELNRSMIERNHLMDRISAHRDRPLLLISGQAGSGKTSLICQWIKKENVPTAWYSIDETDNDPDIFFRYFLTALGNTEDRLNKAIRPLLQHFKTMSKKEIIPTLIQALLTLKNDVYIVMDDFHHISLKSIKEIVHRLVQYMPPRLHLIIISRHNLDSLFSRFRIQGKTFDIAARDLAFTKDEGQRFFSEIMAVDLSEDQLNQLNRYLEGWVSGFQLVGLSIKKRSVSRHFEESLKNTAQVAIDYLMNEVIGQQTENTKQFLFQTALLNRFNIDLAREITGMDHAADVIDELHRKNLFLITLNSRQGWYRYHPLLLETIRDQAMALNPDIRAFIYQKAALWFAKNHYYEDAFQHAFASGEAGFTADLMEDYLLDLYNRGESAAPLKWLYRLPERVFLHRPLLRLYECGFKLEAMDILGVEGVFKDFDRQGEEAFNRYNFRKRRLCHDFFPYLKIAYQMTIKPGDAVGMDSDDVCDKMHEENNIFCASTKLLVGLNHLYRGQPKAAGNFIQEAASLIFSTDNVRARIACRRYLSMLAKHRGRLHHAESILKEGFDFLEQKGLGELPLKLLLYFPMAEIYYEKNDIENALEYLITSEKFAEQSGYYTDLLQSCSLLSGIYWSTGELEKAVLYRRRIQTISGTIDNAFIRNLAEAHVCLLALNQGERRLAEKWAKKRQFHGDEPFSLLYVFEGMAQANIFLHQGDVEKTTRLLILLRRRCLDHGHMAFVLYLDIFLSCAALLEEDHQKAKSFLYGAMAFSETQGYIRPYVDAAPLVLPQLLEISKEREPVAETSHLKALIRACSGPGIDHRSLSGKNAVGKALGITSREMEILEWMAAGYKDREIARKAFISLHTVKSHAKNIYKKMDVPGRMQAVSKAREMGMFG